MENLILLMAPLMKSMWLSFSLAHIQTQNGTIIFQMYMVFDKKILIFMRLLGYIFFNNFAVGYLL
jgi:hypothetical protein